MRATAANAKAYDPRHENQKEKTKRNKQNKQNKQNTRNDHYGKNWWRLVWELGKIRHRPR
jgi:hypothetical protein